MKKNNFNYNKLLFCIISISLLLFSPIASSNFNELYKKDNVQIKNIEYFKSFSFPITKIEGDYIQVDLQEKNSYILMEGYPKLPVFSKIFELPFGSEIIDIEFSISDTKNLKIDKKIKPVPIFQSINDINPPKLELNYEIYSSDIYYPNKWIDYKVGVGIKDEYIIKFLSLRINPIRYNPIQNDVQFIDNIKIKITYSEPELKILENDDNYDLVIISPSEFINILSPLVNHKNDYEMRTILKPLEDIYSDFNGRDNQEKIKYFVKYSIEEWNTKYILLVGDINKLPIRTTDAYPWSGYHGNGILSDLYYADIYDEDFMFCSWDSNNNNVFGEIEESNHMMDFINIDDVDLYPDVHIGRIPCSNSDELSIVVDKIINYEVFTYDQIWFNKIILAGGDTFPLSKGSLPFIYEGEITNTKVAEQLPSFEKIKLWSSKRNLNAHTFNKAIRQGAGFLTYAGHGFEHGWGTYRPNALRRKMGILQPLYYTPFIKNIRNDFRLPIIFFDACLTAKLDFNISDLRDYYGLPVSIINLLPGNRYTNSDFFPCLTWSFLKEENGGCIASIGATRPAYTYVDRFGVYAGAGYLDVHFFKAYYEGITIGEMLTQSQLDYINYVGKDFFTIEEFMLVGDPSLKVGGYP